jgi:phage shock protein PspC (stress-responsive transcriptional regulator)
MSALDNRAPIVAPATRSFHLDRTNAKVFGVCAGIAHYFGINPMIVRIAFAAGTIIGFGSLILVYLAIALIAD